MAKSKVNIKGFSNSGEEEVKSRVSKIDFLKTVIQTFYPGLESTFEELTESEYIDKDLIEPQTVKRVVGRVSAMNKEIFGVSPEEKRSILINLLEEELGETIDTETKEKVADLGYLFVRQFIDESYQKAFNELNKKTPNEEQEIDTNKLSIALLKSYANTESLAFPKLKKEIFTAKLGVTIIKTLVVGLLFLICGLLDKEGIFITHLISLFAVFTIVSIVGLFFTTNKLTDKQILSFEPKNKS